MKQIWSGKELKDLVVECLPSNYGMLDRKGKDDVRANLLGVTGMYEFDVLINNWYALNYGSLRSYSLV